MQDVVVRGRFVTRDHQPVDGIVTFYPSKIWLEEDGQTYPVPAPLAKLEDGSFEVTLVRTDQHGLPWFYYVESPVGKWTIRITEDGPLQLRSLLPQRFST